MKLIFCPECHDIKRLWAEPVTCKCGLSKGRYFKNGIDAVIEGKAIPLGISNHSFLSALDKRPQRGDGSCFEAFVIPHSCKTILENN